MSRRRTPCPERPSLELLSACSPPPPMGGLREVGTPLRKEAAAGRLCTGAWLSGCARSPWWHIAHRSAGQRHRPSAGAPGPPPEHLPSGLGLRAVEATARPTGPSSSFAGCRPPGLLPHSRGQEEGQRPRPATLRCELCPGSETRSRIRVSQTAAGIPLRGAEGSQGRGGRGRWRSQPGLGQPALTSRPTRLPAPPSQNHRPRGAPLT